MFLEDDIETFVITIDLPEREKEESLVERFIAKYPLSTLKFDSIGELVIMLRQSIGELPSLRLSGKGVSLEVTKAKINFEITERKEAKIKEEKETISVFSEKNLNQINNDFNFVIASLLGLLQVESLKAKAYFKVGKKIDRDIKLDNFLSQSFWDNLKEFEDIHVTGLQAEFGRSIKELKVSDKIRFSKDKDVLNAAVFCDLELKGPIDISFMVKDRLEIVNIFCQRIAGEP